MGIGFATDTTRSRARRFIFAFAFALLAAGALAAAPARAAEPPSLQLGFVTQWGSRGSGDGEFYGPLGIATDAAGNVYVVDGNNERVEKFSSDGVFLGKWGGPGLGDGQFYEPDGIAADAAGNVYVVDGHSQVQKFSSDGVFLGKWGSFGSDDGQFGWFPSGIAIDATGNVYVADTGNNRIQKFDSNGVFLTAWSSGFGAPGAVATDAAGNVYVGSYGNPGIRKFSSSGVFLGSLDSNLAHGLATDPAGKLHAAEADSNAWNAAYDVKRFGASGAPLDSFGSRGSGVGEFLDPTGIAVDADGAVYVADTGNDRIQKLAPLLPSISGRLQVGETLTADPGSWTGEPSFAYQWRADGVDIADATEPTYTLTAAEVGTRITVLVTATNTGGSTEAESAAETVPPALISVASYARYGTGDSKQVTVPTVANPILVFAYAGKKGGDTLTTVTYAGRPLTRLDARSQGLGRVELWYLLDPPTGSHTLTWAKTGGGQNTTWGVSVFANVDQTTPFGPAVQAGSTQDPVATDKSVVVDADPGDLVIDVIGLIRNSNVGSPGGPIPGAGQSAQWSRRYVTTQGGSSSEPAASPATMSWSAGGSGKVDWAQIAAPLHPVGGIAGGRLRSTTHTQSSTTATDVVPGTLVTDTATVTGAGPTPTGTVTFFLCDPATVSANGGDCRQGGTQGPARPLDASGRAISGPRSSTTAVGKYCWRAEYSGDATYEPSTEPGTASECFTVATASGGQVAFEAAGSYSRYGTSDSKQVTVPNVASPILVFAFAGKKGGDALTSVTYAGRPLQTLAGRDQGRVHLELRYLLDPPAGTAALAWTKTGASQNLTWGWTLYSGVDQTTPFGTPVQNGASDDDTRTMKYVAVPAAPGDLVVDAFAANGDIAAATAPIAGGSQTVRWARGKSTTEGGSSDRQAGLNPVTMAWLPYGIGTNHLDWAQIAAPLRPAP
jgi:sugar lactone lactonase YvrE